MKRAHTSSDYPEEENMVCKRSLKDEKVANPITTQSNDPPDACNEPTVHKPNNQQQYLIDHVIQHIKSEKDGQLDIFVEGTAGTGKTTLLRLLHKALVDCCGSGSVILTAPTGRAAYTIGGKTLHAAFAIPFMKDECEEEFKDDEDTEELIHDQLKSKITGKYSELESKMNDKYSEIKNKLSGKYSELRNKMNDKYPELSSTMNDEYSALENKMSDNYSELRSKMNDKYSETEREINDRYFELKREMNDKYSALVNKMSGKYSKVGSKMDRYFKLRHKLNAKYSKLGSKMNDKYFELASKMSDKYFKLESKMNDEYPELKNNMTEKYSELKYEVNDKFSELKIKMCRKYSELECEMSDKYSELGSELSDIRFELGSGKIDKYLEPENKISGKYSEMEREMSAKNFELESKLNDKYSKLEKTMSDKYFKLENIMSGKHSELKNKMSGEYSELESEMSDKYSKLESEMSDKYSELESEMSDKYFELESKMSDTYSKLENDMRQKYSELYANTRVLVIYDVFMMSSKVYNYVDRRLQEIKIQKKPFGGLHLIKFGDFKQLPSYRVNPVFNCELWKRRTKCYQLQEVLGPTVNQEYGELLQRFAYGDLTENVITKLKSRKCQDPPNAPVLCCTNAEVRLENENVMDGRCDGVSIAVDKEAHEEDDENAVDNEDDRILADKIILVKGLRYALTRNLNVDKGLVNGVIGTLKDITKDDKDSDKVISVSIEFSENSGLCLKEPFLVSIGRIALVCKTGGELQLRNQLPIRIAEAMTIHRSQGFTYDRVTVLPISWTGTHQYTAFSRVKALDNLYLREYYTKPNVDHPVDVNAELIRLFKVRSITDSIK